MPKRKPRMVLVQTHTSIEITPDSPTPVWWDKAVGAALVAFYAVKDAHTPADARRIVSLAAQDGGSR